MVGRPKLEHDAKGCYAKCCFTCQYCCSVLDLIKFIVAHVAYVERISVTLIHKLTVISMFLAFSNACDNLNNCV